MRAGLRMDSLELVRPEPISIQMDGTCAGTLITGLAGQIACVGMTIEQTPNGPPRLVLDLQTMAVDATFERAAFRVAPPEGGKPREVRRIEFADGTQWEAA